MIELVAERALHVEVDRHVAVCDVRDSLRSRVRGEVTTVLVWCDDGGDRWGQQRLQKERSITSRALARPEPAATVLVLRRPRTSQKRRAYPSCARPEYRLLSARHLITMHMIVATFGV